MNVSKYTEKTSFRTIIYPFLSVLLLFCFSSCIELIEDTTFHNDGSGKYKLILNLSSSKIRLNSAMELDSIKGQKVPSKSEIRLKLENYTSYLNQMKGIENAQGTIDFSKWLIEIQFNFSSVKALQNGLVAMGKELFNQKTPEAFETVSVSYTDSLYERKLSPMLTDKWKNEIKNDKDFERLKEGKIVFIQRFDYPIKKTSNSMIRISKNKKAAMVQLSLIQIINKPQQLDYSIKLN